MSSRLSAFLQSIFPGIVRLGPPDASRRLMAAAGALYFAAFPSERRRIERNVRDLLGPGERTERVRRAVFGHLIDHYFEKLLVASRGRRFIEEYTRRRVSVEGLGLLDEYLGRGKGVLGVTAHWGAVEIIPPLLASRGYPISIVLETTTRRLRKRLERLVEGRDVELIIASRGDRVLARILDSLARGRLLVTQVDEVDAWRRRRSRTIGLFGKELYFDNSLDFIAKRSGAPTLGLFCGRARGRRYRFVCEDIASDPSHVDVSVASMRLWERYTLESPEQWYQWPKWEAMKTGA